MMQGDIYVCSADTLGACVILSMKDLLHFSYSLISYN